MLSGVRELGEIWVPIHLLSKCGSLPRDHFGEFNIEQFVRRLTDEGLVEDCWARNSPERKRRRLEFKTWQLIAGPHRARSQVLQLEDLQR